MRGGLGLAAAGAVLVSALTGCIPGGSVLSAASLKAQPSAKATLTWAQRDCLAATAALNDVAGPLERHDAAGVVAAGRLAQTNEAIVRASTVDNGTNVAKYAAVAEYAGTVLAEIVIIAHNATAYEQSEATWSLVIVGKAALASAFNSLEPYCSAVGVTSGTASAQPSSYPAPYSVGCPTSGQLLAEWNAAPASVRDAWVELTPTGFTDTECWHQWVVSNPVVQANGTVIFTHAGGQLSVFPESELSEFDAAICGAPGIGKAWSGPAGPASCPQSG